MKKTLILLIALLQALFAVGQTENADTTSTQALDEVVVEAQMQRTSATVSTYTPTGKQKNASQNGIDLLNRMAIPQLRLSPGNESAVQTAAGQEVAIFIDYLPASAQDLSGMRMTDVKKVEYLDYPTDPRFRGNAHVVNFIMQKYEYGGYFKAASDNYLIANSYNLNLFSKIQYRRMTYDIALGGYYSDNSHTYTNGTDAYRLLQPDGSLREIERILATDDASLRRKYIWPTFKALYQSDKVTLRNTIGTNFDHFPAKNLAGTVAYSTSDFAPTTFSTRESSRSNSVTYEGDWNFMLNGKSSLNVNPIYSYSHTRQSSLYSEGSSDYINDAADDTHKVGIYAAYIHNFGKAGALRVLVPFSYVRSDTRYSGTADTHSIITASTLNPGVMYNYSNERFSGEINVGYIWSRSKAGDVRESQSSPSVELSLQYSPNNHHSLTFSTHYFVSNIPGSYRSSAVIQGSPMMSYTGNPALTYQKNTSASLGYTWLPNNTFNFSAYGNFWNVGNRYCYSYESTPSGIVRTIAQPAGSYTNVSAGAYGVARLLQNKLQLVAQLSYNFTHDGKPYDWNKSALSAALQATYYLNNWYFKAYYVTANKQSIGSMNGFWRNTGDRYGIQAGWSNASWNLRAMFCNFARWNWKKHSDVLESPYYDSYSTTFSTNGHAFISISATYTFGFGKKIQRGDEASQKTGVSSGILQ